MELTRRTNSDILGAQAMPDRFKSPPQNPPAKRSRGALHHPPPGSRRTTSRLVAGKSQYDQGEQVEVAFDSNWHYLGRVVTGMLEDGDLIAVNFHDGTTRVKVCSLVACWRSPGGYHHTCL